ncbi:MAG: mechanosensitive ion channel family protein [Bacteroidaceae bacterium]|nr:mechanosensitive ion channel family protein [Bacteroidaceae bacterium]
MKRIVLLLTIALLTFTQSQAVLKEKDLAKTLNILRLELNMNYREQQVMMQRYEQQSAVQHKQLIDYMQRCDQISLMLYSQKSDHTFDIAYACTQATKLYKELGTNNIPYGRIRDRITSEIARYDSLITALKELPPAIGNNTNTAADSINQLIEEDNNGLANSQRTMPFELNEQERKDRDECLTYAKALRNNLRRILKSVEEDKDYYDVVTNKVSKLYHYSQRKYKDLRNNIFNDGSSNYFKLLRTLPQQLQHAKRDYDEKYSPLGEGERARSEWRGPIVPAVSIFMLFYILVATLLSNIIIRWVPTLISKLFPKFAHRAERWMKESVLNIDKTNYKQQRRIIILALGLLIFVLAITIAQQFLKPNLFLMAAKLMIDFAWLFEAILISMLIRLKAEQCNRGIAIYMPFISMALIIIFFRILLIPNNIINLICPPILLGLTIWQYFSIRRNKSYLPMSDILYSTISLIVLVVSCVSSWVGYTLMAVQVIIWWTFLLAAIETITCCYDLLEMYEQNVLSKRIVMDASTYSKRKELAEMRKSGVLFSRMEKGRFIHKTWFYDFINKALVPMATIFAIVASFFFAADIFEMTESCYELFMKVIIDEPKYIRLSVYMVVIVAGLYFAFRYLNYLLRSFYHLYKTKMTEENGEDFNETLARNVIAIVIWGFYIILVLVLLKVPQTGISVVAAGLATGMGFAMKDLLENFFYGISLMSGRLRVGDYIECDGIQGKVESITYQSTQIITLDGSVIAFLNTSLFNKNFKNLTRNHSYELVKIPVGIAYGNNIQQVRKMLLDAIKPLCVVLPDGRDIVNKEKSISVLFSDFGDSSVNLIVAMWILVDQKPTFMAQVKETIYDTLNKNNIEIPFPQHDVYLHTIANDSDK